MYIAHTSNLFFSPVNSGDAVFALSSRDKTSRSTDTSILYCYIGTIKEKKLDIKNFLFLVLCVRCVVVDGVVVFQFSWWCGFFLFFF